MTRFFVVLLLAASFAAPISAEGDAPSLYALMQELEAVRGLPLLHRVESTTLTVEETRKVLAARLDDELDPVELEAMTAMLEILELIPQGYDLKRELLALYESQVGGFYDPETRKMVLVESSDALDLRSDPAARTVVLVHELDHALTDQHYGLRVIDELAKIPGREDEVFAYRALAEGDAVLAMMLYQLRTMGVHEPSPAALGSTEVVVSAMRAGQEIEPTLARAPRYISAALIEPYALGTALVHRTWQEGGWEAVDALWARPPRSSEQLLHPERWDDLPSKVTPPSPRDGYEERLQMQMGELGLLIWLESRLESEDAARAAAGWDGDLIVFSSRAARPDEAELGVQRVDLMQMSTVWDTVADADEFVDATSRWLFAVGRSTGITEWIVRQQGRRVSFELELEPYVPESIEGLGRDPWDRVVFDKDEAE